VCLARKEKENSPLELYFFHKQIRVMYSDLTNSSEVRRRGGNNTTTAFDHRSPATFSSSPNPSPTYGLENIESFVKMASNSGRDRTSEFAATVKSLRVRNVMSLPNGQNHTKNRNETLAQQSRQFMNIAASIGRDIASTYTKLEKLTLLAKKRTLFDDRPQEIQELIGIIKLDTGALNKQIDQLNRISKAQQETLRSKHQATHSSTVVAALQLRLASMTSDFKQVLEVRSENLRESKSRREQFSQGAVTRSMPQMDGYPSGSVLATAAMDDDEAAAAQSNGQVAISMGESTAMMQMQHGGDMTHLQSRADAMQNIESTIVELGGIFNQLATMITEQNEMIERIDGHVDDASVNVEAGHSEILKYFQNVSSNRWLMVKIFGVLIFFFIFFVIFMA